MDKVINEVARLAADFAEVPMLSRTHGQTASPTTMGKEMAVFAYRLKRQRDLVSGRELIGRGECGSVRAGGERPRDVVSRGGRPCRGRVEALGAGVWGTMGWRVSQRDMV